MTHGPGAEDVSWVSVLRPEVHGQPILLLLARACGLSRGARGDLFDETIEVVQVDGAVEDEAPRRRESDNLWQLALREGEAVEELAFGVLDDGEGGARALHLS